MRLSSLREVFGVDLRSLALLRIGLGLLLLVDIALRAQFLEAHYSDFGLFPRSLAAAFHGPWALSLHMANGACWFQAGLFFIQCVFALGLTVGYYSRLCGLVSFVLLVSLHYRNPMILTGADNLLLALLFWGLFLPLGARCSLDAVQTPNPRPGSSRYLSVASGAILIQVMSLYLFTALLKTGEVWWPEGTAVYYALHLDQLATPFGVWLRQFPELLQALSYLVLSLEYAAPILAFIPIATPAVRGLVLAALAAMHLGFWLCLEIGFFPFASLVSLTVLIPTVLWDRLAWPHWLAQARAPLKQAADRLPRTGPGRIRPTPWSSALAAFFIVWIVGYNLTTLPAVDWTYPRWAMMPGELLRLEQRWSMFAPHPYRDDGWFVAPGQLEDGTEVDLLQDRIGEADWEKPEYLSQTYPSFRWRKYHRRLSRKKWQDLRLYYAQYLCRNWNRDAAQGERLKWLSLVFVRERTLPNYRPSKLKRIALWEHDCLAATPVEVAPPEATKQQLKETDAECL